MRNLVHRLFSALAVSALAVTFSATQRAFAQTCGSLAAFSALTSRAGDGGENALSSANNGTLRDGAANAGGKNAGDGAKLSPAITSAATLPGQIVISEFRFRGPNGACDEFIELSNQTDADMTVATTDSSAGWAVVAYNPSTVSSTTIYTVPVNTVIPARGHFLITNPGTASALLPSKGGVAPTGCIVAAGYDGGAKGVAGVSPLLCTGGYSLGGYAQPDQTGVSATQATYTYDIPDNGGIAIFNTANPANFGDTTRLDAVGFTAVSGFYETTPLSPSTGVTDNQQFSFARKLATGRPLDTNNNSNDFMLVATRPDLILTTGATALQGAPGPENTASPVNRGDLIKARLIDSTVTLNDPPNRDRNPLPYNDTVTTSDPTGAAPGEAPYAHGWLALRRRFVNNTGAQVTGLRFRVVIITANRTNTLMNNGTADIRAISSADVSVSSNDPTVCGAQPLPCSVPVKGLKVDQQGPMSQPRGGGLNTSLSIDLSGNPIPVGGGTVDVQFLLGVQEAGAFSFFVVVEALPGVNNTAADLGGSPAPAGFDGAKRAGAATPKAGPGKGTAVKSKQ
jgi:hypothetical protein